MRGEEWFLFLKCWYMHVPPKSCCVTRHTIVSPPNMDGLNSHNNSSLLHSSSSGYVWHDGYY